MESTSITLLERLRQRPDDPKAWSRFVDVYTPLMLHWARRLGLRPHDAADFVQDVFATLVQKMPAFTYDPDKTFRGWLRTVTYNKWRDQQRRKEVRRASANEGDVSELPSPDTFDAVSEEDERRYLVRRAMEVMQTEFEPVTWKACWEFVVEGLSADEIARNLGITRNAVYIAKCRVLRRLRRELQGMLA